MWRSQVNTCMHACVCGVWTHVLFVGNSCHTARSCAAPHQPARHQGSRLILHRPGAKKLQIRRLAPRMEHRQPAAHASIICGVPLDLASNLHRFLNGKAPRSHTAGASLVHLRKTEAPGPADFQRRPFPICVVRSGASAARDDVPREAFLSSRHRHFIYSFPRKVNKCRGASSFSSAFFR